LVAGSANTPGAPLTKRLTDPYYQPEKHNEAQQKSHTHDNIRHRASHTSPVNHLHSVAWEQPQRQRCIQKQPAQKPTVKFERREREKTIRSTHQPTVWQGSKEKIVAVNQKDSANPLRKTMGGRIFLYNTRCSKRRAQTRLYIASERTGTRHYCTYGQTNSSQNTRIGDRKERPVLNSLRRCPAIISADEHPGAAFHTCNVCVHAWYPCSERKYMYLIIILYKSISRKLTIIYVQIFHARFQNLPHTVYDDVLMWCSNLLLMAG